MSPTAGSSPFVTASGRLASTTKPRIFGDISYHRAQCFESLFREFWMIAPVHNVMASSCEASPDGGEPPSSQLSVGRQHNDNHPIHGAISPDNPYKNQIEEMRRELDEQPCRACMYTGVSVCMGLSIYFANLAIDESTLAKNRRFLWMCSAGSVAAGAYRWYLG